MKVGIIGHTGYIGPRHVKAWDELGVKWEGCNTTGDWTEFIKRDFDIIDIATPIWLHPVMIRESIKAGKDVICEKPLANNLKDAYEIIELSKFTKKKIGIVFQCRYNRKFLALKKEIEDGVYGQIKMAVFQYFRNKDDEHFKKRPWRKSINEAGGFAALNIVIHHIDQLQWMFGFPCQTYGVVAPHQVGYDVEDTFIGTFKFPTGTIGAMICSTRANPPKHTELSIYGTKGHKTIQMRENEYHKDNFKAFIEGKGYVTPVEAVKSLRLCLSITK